MSAIPESQIFDALKSLVSNRCYANTFPQPPTSPLWPAIRFVRISAAPVIDICGDGDAESDDTADVRVQLDLCAQSYGAMMTLRAQVKTAMATLNDPKPVWDGEFITFDAETKTHRCSLDYLFYPSTDDGSSSPA